MLMVVVVALLLFTVTHHVKILCHTHGCKELGQHMTILVSLHRTLTFYACERVEYIYTLFS
jgi:hypothetical protein